MSTWWVLAHLFFLSAEDIRTGELLMPAVWELAVGGAVRAFCLDHAVAWQPGIVLLFFSYLTKEQIGYGDSWLMLALGMWISAGELAFVFMAGLSLAAVFALLLGEREIPLVPFLTAAYLMKGWL